MTNTDVASLETVDIVICIIFLMFVVFHLNKSYDSFTSQPTLDQSSLIDYKNQIKHRQPSSTMIRSDANVDTDVSVDDLVTDLNKSLVTEAPEKYTDANYFAGPLLKGEYGGVPVYLYNNYDDERAMLWRKTNNLYLPNSKEYWKAINYPIEADNWIANGEPYDYPFYKHTPIHRKNM